MNDIHLPEDSFALSLNNEIPQTNSDFSAENYYENWYPVSYQVPLSVEVVAGVGRALAEAGWPPVRHREDYARLAHAVRWFVHGRSV